jgi:5-methyltetrahydrofolate--homocysteine methyltransferase
MVPAAKILETAIAEKVDVIGLSGLITPSLDEMIHVAREMKRLDFKVPLLIGGATTSRVHTAVKIAPSYPNGVIHVLDASRAVGVVGNLISKEHRDGYLTQILDEQEAARVAFAGKRRDKKQVPIEEARRRRTPIVWDSADMATPEFTGVRVLDDYPLEELIPYIDWSFFMSWELRGKYPQIFNDPVVGERAREVFDDAQVLLQRMVSERLVKARGVYGFWPANAVGSDDIALYTDETREHTLATLHMLRQQTEKSTGEFNKSLADFVAPRATGLADYVGGFVVTAGIGLDKLVADFKADNDDYNAIMAEALTDRLAEAFAERLHKIARDAWGYGADENLTHEDLIRERYRGIRPAPGYPACPDHTEKTTLFRLLDAENATGVTLTESMAMYPASSVSGWYLAHPQAEYFSIGQVDRDQVTEYAKRKSMPLAEAERWLSPVLAYDP